MRTIFLDEDDDIVSIGDRLERIDERRVVLVLPDQGGVLKEYLDLALLRRQADKLYLDVGLVTNRSRTVDHAKALGFPTFASIEASRRNQRRWWRGRKRRERVGRRTVLTLEDKREVERRQTERPVWQRWIRRYIAIVLFFVALSALFLAAAYAVPGATVTLRPEIQSIRVEKELSADPQPDEGSSEDGAVAARTLIVVQEWRADVETTGETQVPDAPARGKVVFVNRLDEPVMVPAGTRVGTSAGERIVFQTLTEIEVPGALGGTAEVEVLAVEPGPQGNVAPNLVNRVEGTLAIQLEVRNLEEMTGGGIRPERTVTEADQERLRSQVLQQLQVLALGEMEGVLADHEFLARESLQVSRIMHETYSHFPGEATGRLTLELRAELQATAVDESHAVGLVYEELAKSVEAGFELVPSSLTFGRGRVSGVTNEGRVTFSMLGEGLVAARLRTEGPLEEIAGQEIDVAMAYLYEQLPLRQYPSVTIWPNWFGRLPYLPVRIQIRVETVDFPAGQQ